MSHIFNTKNFFLGFLLMALFVAIAAAVNHFGFWVLLVPAGIVVMPFLGYMVSEFIEWAFDC